MQPETVSPPWHALTPDQALHRLGSGPEGLSAREATSRLARHGPNTLPRAAGRTPLQRFLLQFHNVLIYVLLASACITALLHHWADTSVILGVVVINAVIGFLQEGKAERAMEAIRTLLSQQATVLRDGRRLQVPAEELVPGDVVLLASGDKVPADLRLTRVRSLRVDESALTGESVPVDKSAEATGEEAVVAERRSVAFSGTLVTYGQATGLVVATGAATEIGRINDLLTRVHPLETPLLLQVARFGRALSFWIAVLSAATFTAGVWLRGYPLDEMFLATVGLAVAAIPEGLPAVITITLAIGVQRMARRNAIVRRLPAVETLGSVSVICTDKTGTLTRNEMMVQTVTTALGRYEVSGAGYDPRGGFAVEGTEILPERDPALLELCRAAALCNDGALGQSGERWLAQGDPTEAALLVLARKAGFHEERLRVEYPRSDAIPFESEHRFMATLHRDHAGHGFVLLKGAPEEILEMCAFERATGTDRPINPHQWRGEIERLAARGERVLAVAFKAAPHDQHELGFADVAGGLTLLGLAGLVDPPRPEAIAAVAQCRRAGIRVKMITGDHAATALSIGTQMGIGNGSRVLTGAELEAMDQAALEQAALETDLFARASPEHKLRLVEALQTRGAVVAMTGDGVNDAPALRRADVGVAMGANGTEAAKEAGEMVLADDNFATIAHAVEEGRTIYANIRKSILFILPTNGGEALVVTAAVLFGVQMPLTPLQILWVNMITAVTLALALAFEPTEPDTMRQPPRAAREPLLSWLLAWRIAFVSLLLVAGTMGLFLWEYEAGTSLDRARTIAVNTLVLCEVFYLFSTRYLREPVLNREGLLGNRYVLLTIALVMAFQLLFTYAPPMQELFATVAMDVDEWWRPLLVGLLVLGAVETEKWIVRRLA